MRIGVPKEIKDNEFRVGLSPSGTHELSTNGHDVFIETHAGSACGFKDEDYISAGARILSNASEIFRCSDLIVKVKEPLASERKLLSKRHTLFTYLHLAPDPLQTNDLISSKACCIAYETVTDERGTLPLLTPMSEIAGRMAVQAGAHSLEKPQGGRGVLLSGAPGVPRAEVLIIGGGVVGRNAAQIAIGMGANVTIIDKSVDVLRIIEQRFGSKIKTLYASETNLSAAIILADLVICAVLIPGAKAPKLIKRADLKTMKSGAVIVDVAIDQGGCCETSKPTTHSQPSFIVDGIVHYCVANMPGAVALTATLALTNATLPFIVELANKGVKQALSDNIHLANGVSVLNGMICCENVAKSQGLSYTPYSIALAKP